MAKAYRSATSLKKQLAAVDEYIRVYENWIARINTEYATVRQSQGKSPRVRQLDSLLKQVLEREHKHPKPRMIREDLQQLKQRFYDDLPSEQVLDLKFASLLGELPSIEGPSGWYPIVPGCGHHIDEVVKNAIGLLSINVHLAKLLRRELVSQINKATASKPSRTRKKASRKKASRNKTAEHDRKPPQFEIITPEMFKLEETEPPVAILHGTRYVITTEEYYVFRALLERHPDHISQPKMIKMYPELDGLRLPRLKKKMQADLVQLIKTENYGSKLVIPPRDEQC